MIAGKHIATVAVFSCALSVVGAYIRSETEKWAKVIKRLGIEPQ